jgi:hypothetical protein
MYDAEKGCVNKYASPVSTIINTVILNITLPLSPYSHLAHNIKPICFSRLFIHVIPKFLSPFLLVSLSLSLPATASSNIGFYSYPIYPPSIYSVTKNQDMRKELSYYQICLILYLLMSNSYSSKSSSNLRTPCLNRQCLDCCCMCARTYGTYVARGLNRSKHEFSEKYSRGTTQRNGH